MKEIFDSSFTTLYVINFLSCPMIDKRSVIAGNESHNVILNVFLGRRRKGFLPSSSFFTIRLITWPLYDGAEKSAIQVKLTPGKIFSGKGILEEGREKREGERERNRPYPRAKYKRRTMDTLFRLSTGCNVIPAAARYCS